MRLSVSFSDTTLNNTALLKFRSPFDKPGNYMLGKNYYVSYNEEVWNYRYAIKGYFIAE